MKLILPRPGRLAGWKDNIFPIKLIDYWGKRKQYINIMTTEKTFIAESLYEKYLYGFIVKDKV